MIMEEFEPKILGFLCRWCCDLPDLRGILETRHPPRFCSTEVICSCGANEFLVLKAFAGGADGVLVGGCLAEECRYMRDSLSARKEIAALKPLLEAIGVSSERLRLEPSSPSESAMLAEKLGSFAQTIKQLGPSPFKRRRC